MKKIIPIITILITSFIVLSSYNTKDKKELKMLPNQYQTTLDSLQGIWYDIDDSTYHITINGRNWITDKRDSGLIQLLSNRYIYFSDTIISSEKMYNNLLDTSKQSGEYLITVNSQDSVLYCYYLNGFTFYNGDTTFSISPTDNYKANLTRAFQKTQ